MKLSGISMKILIPVLAVALICVGFPTVHSLTSGNTEASPQVHNAVAEFTLPEDGDGKTQSGPLWYYQYSLDAEETEWINCTRVHGDYWRPATSDNLAYMGVSQMGRMHIRNYNGFLDNLEIPAVSYAFVSDGDGRITMNGSAELNNASDGYYPELRITVNGETVYPQEGWLTVSKEAPVCFDDVAFDVANGDIIRFEMNAGAHLEKNCEVLVSWTPSFIFTKSGDEYTETNDIFNRLTAFMRSIFTSAESKTLDSASTSNTAAAKEFAKKAQYGLYSPLNAVYGKSEILPSDSTSVWKFAVLSDCGSRFYTPNGNAGLSACRCDNGLRFTWDTQSTLSELCILPNDGSVKKYTVCENSVVLPLSPDLYPVKAQLITDDLFSEILTVYENCENNTTLTEERLVYLNDVTACNASKSNAYFKLCDSAVASTYSFYYSAGDTNINDYHKRSICFSAVPDEKMRFGFTVPFDGEYEISAPLEVSSENATVTYAVLKQTCDGTVTALKAAAEYGGENIFCNLRAALKKGDTVWFEAYSDKATEIEIGIPHFTLNESGNNSSGETVNVFRAVDYTESAYKNENITYGNSATTENSLAAWSFGYFINPVTSDDFDGLKLSEYTVGKTTEELEALLTPYELIRHNIYNALPVATKANNVITTGTYGVAGNLYPALGNTYNERSYMGNQYKCKGIFGCTGITQYVPTGEKMNLGIYMRFNAPVSGNALLHLSDEADIKNNERFFVIKNGAVFSVYTGTVKKGTVIDLGDIKRGDTVTLCYAKLTDGKYFGYIGMPYMKVTGKSAKISLGNSADEPISETSAQIGTQISLNSAKKKIGRLFLGWYDSQSEKLSADGEKLSITADTSLTAVYIHYGDLNSDGKITAEDLGGLKRKLLGFSAGQYENGDVNGDENLNILDLVRMKKWLSGVPCMLGK